MRSNFDVIPGPIRTVVNLITFAVISLFGGASSLWTSFQTQALAQGFQQLPPKNVEGSARPTERRSRRNRPVEDQKVDRVEKAAPAATAPKPEGEVFEFRVDDLPVSSDPRPALQFKDASEKDGSVAEVPDYKSQELSESEVFSVYPGYPKHQVALGIRPYSVSTNWSYSGQDFAFTTTSIGYGLTYSFQPTPRLLLEAEYSGYGLETPSASVDPYLVNASSAVMDSVFFKGAYCFFGDSSFFRQLCPGIDLGYDTYPLLDFVSSTTLQLGRVRDIIVGLNLAYQIPMTDSTRLRVKAGYNRGTGSGNSGTLTSKQNTSYFLLADVLWSLKVNHDILVGMEYRSRQASLSGKRGQNTDSWETKSTIVGVQLAYQYSF